jgi:flagellar protein FliO/FliZ
MDMSVSQYFYVFLVLLFVLGLIGAFAIIARRFGLGFPVTGRANTQRRLAVSEMLPIDAKRRLILFRRDDKEHLVLMSSDSSLLIESNIESSLGSFANVLKETGNRLPTSSKEIQ